LIQKRDEIKALEQQNQQLHKDVEVKRGRVERLRTNPEEQELEIRKRLNLVKEGEKSYILQEQRGK
jgi:cell division protein FtsB